MLTGMRPFPTKKELLQSDSQRSNLFEKDGLPFYKVKLDTDEATKVLNDAEFRCLMFKVRFPDIFSAEPEAKSFIEALLSRNPEDRPRYNEITNHAWMKGARFDEDEVLRRPIPDWVKHHANLHSTSYSSTITRQDGQEISGRTKRTLNQCIDDLCCDCFEKYGVTKGENFFMKWTANPRQSTVNLFRHWNYLSEDAIRLEILAADRQKKKTFIFHKTR